MTNKGFVVKNSEKRHFCGCLMPNIYFLLQVGIILLLLLILLQTIWIFDVGEFVAYIYVSLALIAVWYCFVLRRNIIARQYQHCDEYAKKKKEKEMFK